MMVNMPWLKYTVTRGLKKLEIRRDSLLIYQLQRVNKFENIKRLDLLDPWAAILFTHNMPVEDLCMIAQKSCSKDCVEDG